MGVTQIQLSVICKVNHNRWEQKGEYTYISKDRTQVPQPSLKTGGRVPAVPKAGATTEMNILCHDQHRLHSLLTVLFFLIILFTDLATYDSVKHFLLLNTTLVDNSVTHSVSRCRILQLPLFHCGAFYSLAVFICLSVPAEDPIL